MSDNNHDFYNSVEYLQDKVTSLQNDLQQLEDRYDEAIAHQQPEAYITELELDVQNSKRKLLFFSEKLRQLNRY